LAAEPAAIEKIRITIYEPAFSIIGDSHKRDPRTRQSADHSMVYIIATLLRKAVEAGVQGSGFRVQEFLWKDLMLMPDDYNDAALFHPLTRELMRRIDLLHGGPDYDAKYPDGIPTTVEITHRTLGTVSSGLVMYPEGHARNTGGNLPALLEHKFNRLAGLGVGDMAALRKRLTNLINKSSAEIRELYSFKIDHVRPA
jgi:2-methylcitrate dehydratase